MSILICVEIVKNYFKLVRVHVYVPLDQSSHIFVKIIFLASLQSLIYRLSFWVILNSLFDFFDGDKTIFVEVKLIKQVYEFFGFLLVKGHDTESDLTLNHASILAVRLRIIIIVFSVRTHLDPITFLRLILNCNTSNLSH